MSARVSWPRRISPCFALLVTMGAAAAGGCRVQMCSDELDTQGRYSVKVIDVYGPSGHYLSDIDYEEAGYVSPDTCGTNVPPALGDTFELQAYGTYTGVACKVVLADIVSSGSLQVLGRPMTQQGTNAFHGDGSIMNGGGQIATSIGEGDLILALSPEGGSGGIFAAPVPGQHPTMVLNRSFYPETAPGCFDQFVVQLTKE